MHDNFVGVGGKRLDGTPKGTRLELVNAALSNFALVRGVGRSTLRANGHETSRTGLCRVSRGPSCLGGAG